MKIKPAQTKEAVLNNHPLALEPNAPTRKAYSKKSKRHCRAAAIRGAVLRRKVKDAKNKLYQGEKIALPKELSITYLIKQILVTDGYMGAKAAAIQIAEALISKAISGDMSAIIEVLNRIDGKVADKHQIESTPVTLVFKPAESLSAPPETLTITPTINQRVSVTGGPFENLPVGSQEPQQTDFIEGEVVEVGESN